MNENIPFHPFDALFLDMLFPNATKVQTPYGVLYTLPPQTPEEKAEAREKRRGPESKLEILVGKYLQEQGIDVKHQVPCGAGVADIVTPDAIYEIKQDLHPTRIFSAIGQVLIYRQCINPSARAIIVGYPCKKGFYVPQMEKIEASAKQMGVEIIFWNR